FAVFIRGPPTALFSLPQPRAAVPIPKRGLGRGIYSVTVGRDLRKRLESASYPDLGAMMEGYAQAAAELARSEFKQTLDFTSESIDALDEVLVLVSESPERDLDFE